MSTNDRDKSPFDPFDSIGFLTNRVGRLLNNAIRHEMGEDNQLIANCMGLLVDLWQRDGVRQQDLAISVIKDKATIARSLDNLEKENIVVRITDNKDKRNKRIYLTHKGRSLKQSVIPPAIKVMDQAIAGISEDEMKICKLVLGKIYHNLNPDK